MTKKELAKLFVDSFHTDIKEVITSGELKGCGGNAEQRKRGEVIFGNYVSYGKREFSSDYRDFAKRLAGEYGVDWHEIKKPLESKSRVKSFYYQWDPVQVIEIDGLVFRMGRRMMNMPHAILDGCNHTYYIDINDLELVEEIKKLNDERIAAKEQEKKNNFPNEVEEAKQQCREIIRDLRRLLNGEVEFTEEALWRIDEAHFGISVLMD